MQHMQRPSKKHRAHVDEDELIALNAWRRIDRQTREAIKRNFLPDLLEIYEVLPSFLQFKLLFFGKTKFVLPVLFVEMIRTDSELISFPCQEDIRFLAYVFVCLYAT